MTQVASYAIPNGPRADVRTGFNNVLAALRDLNAGPTAPPNPVPHMLWMDTSTDPVLRIRNAANSAWLPMIEVMGMTASLGVNGWQRWPSGMIIQYGRATIPAAAVGSWSGLNVTLPISFPHVFLSAFVTGNNTPFASSASPFFFATQGSLSMIHLQSNYSASASNVSWLAIGQ